MDLELASIDELLAELESRVVGVVMLCAFKSEDAGIHGFELRSLAHSDIPGYEIALVNLLSRHINRRTEGYTIYSYGDDDIQEQIRHVENILDNLNDILGDDDEEDEDDDEDEQE